MKSSDFSASALSTRPIVDNPASASRYQTSELPWRVGLALIIVLMLACYILASNSYWVGDDFNYVRPKDWGTVLHLFNPVNRLVFRPVHWALWAALYALFGTAPLGWHLVHYAMHAANIVWAALLMRQITGRKDLALLAAAFFAIQPAHPETVTWTGGQADLVFAFFWLPALWLWVRWRQGGGRRLWLLAGLLGFISMFGKEAALTLPIMSLWIDLLFGRDWLRWPGKRSAGWWRDWRLYPRLLLDHSLFIAASGIYAGMRIFLVLIGHGGLMYGSAQLGFFSHPLAVLTGYTILSMGPWWVPSSVYDWPIWLQLGIVLVAAALVVAAIRWVGRVALFAVGWMGISLMLTLQAVANRWFYVPAVGLGLLLACVWIKFRDTLWRKELASGNAGAPRAVRTRRFVLALPLALILAWWSILTLVHNDLWRQSGEVSRGLLNQIRTLVPAPPKPSTFYLANPPYGYKSVLLFHSGFGAAIGHVYNDWQDYTAYNIADAPGQVQAALSDPSKLGPNPFFLRYEDGKIMRYPTLKALVDAGNGK